MLDHINSDVYDSETLTLWARYQHNHREAASSDRKSTPCQRCQQKELEHKGGQRQVHDTCIVHTVVGEKVYRARDETTSNSEEVKPITIFILSYIWLKASVTIVILLNRILF